MEARLKAKVALVTGASRGFGAGVAEELAREGARVWIAARSQSDLAEVARDWSYDVVTIGFPKFVAISMP